MTTLDTSPAAPGPAKRSADTDPVAVDPAAARAAVVAELEARHGLRPGPVRDALLALPREVLMPQAYVRRSAPGEDPPRWATGAGTSPCGGRATSGRNCRT
ncbi:hypothetical protein ACWEL8_26655 [Streptomyces sp. NPDC004690]